MSNETYCQYSHLGNGIHQFVFQKATREAVDQHVTQLEKIYESEPNALIRVMIDLRPSGWPPMAYTASALRQSNGRYPNRPTARYAFIYNAGFLLSVARTFFDLLNPSRGAARFFSGSEADKAVDWLLA
jgi:hypothetical protein